MWLKFAPMRILLPFLLGLLLSVCGLFPHAAPAAEGDLGRLLSGMDASDLVPGAEGFGPIDEKVAVAPVLSGGETVAWAFLTSDFVGTTGYSGKPIHVVAAISPDAVLTGARLVEHSEPIVPIGIPDSKIRALTERHAGLDLKAEAAAGGMGAPEVVPFADLAESEAFAVRHGGRIVRLSEIPSEAVTGPVNPEIQLEIPS